MKSHFLLSEKTCTVYFPEHSLTLQSSTRLWSVTLGLCKTIKVVRKKKKKEHTALFLFHCSHDVSKSRENHQQYKIILVFTTGVLKVNMGNSDLPLYDQYMNCLQSLVWDNQEEEQRVSSLFMLNFTCNKKKFLLFIFFKMNSALIMEVDKYH